MIIYFLGLHFFNDPDVAPDLDGNPPDDQVSDAEKQRNSWRRKLKLLRADSRDDYLPARVQVHGSSHQATVWGQPYRYLLPGEFNIDCNQHYSLSLLTCYWMSATEWNVFPFLDEIHAKKIKLKYLVEKQSWSPLLAFPPQQPTYS